MKSLEYAHRRVNDLKRQIKDRDDLISRWATERRLLAKLASDKPEFFNPLVAFEAKRIRDQILANDRT